MRNGMINMENYEAFFLDYLEGNLTGEEREQLFLFLKAHPGLREELEQYEEYRLVPENASFAGKERLKKKDQPFEEIDDDNVEEAMIAYWEGVMTPRQKEQFEEYLQRHPARQEDFRIYGKMFLKPGHVFYAGKKDLFRKTRPAVVWLYRAGTAAAILILVLLLFRQGGVRSPAGGNNMASTHEEKVHGKGMRPEEKPPAAQQVPVVIEKTSIPKESKKEKLPGRRFRSDKAEKNLLPVPEIRGEEKIAYCPLISEFSLPVEEPAREVVVAGHYFQDNTPGNVLTLAEYAALKIKKNILDEDTVSTPRLNAREVALLGVKGINMLTGLNLQVEKKEDPVEEKEYFALTSRLFTYTRVRPAGRRKK